jgi:hypothetical protein
MSTLRASNIYDKDGGSNAVLYGVAAPTGSMGFRNRILNGDCRIDQRNAGASASLTSAQTYFLDRWFAVEDTDGTMTIQQSSTAPTGFSNSAVLTTGTADASLGATQICYVGQKIEGFNFADLAWGTASAQTVTLSFWVRSSLTGTFGGALANNAFNRSYPFTYTISAANTFEYKTVTIAGDTTGTWVGSTNGVGLQLFFGLGVGSTYSGTAGAWAGSGYISATGATSVIGTAGATFYITGVQLEAGSVASPFERLDYGRQLLQCQRYYEQYGMQTSAAGLGYCSVRTGAWYGYIPFMVEKRAAPTVTLTGTFVLAGTAGDIGAQTPTDINEITRQACRPYKGSGSYTAQGAYFTLTTPSTDKLAISAEL